MPQEISDGQDYQDQLFERVSLERQTISDSTFFHCTFRRAAFVESVFGACRFVDCVFEASDLSLIEIPDSTFSATRFMNCKLVGIDWTRAAWPKSGLGEPLSFRECALNHSTFIGLKLQKIRIVDCFAHEVDFREADLSHAILSGTDFEGSIFGEVNLSAADLRGARNYAIDPTTAKLKRAKFSLPEAMSLLYNMDIVLDE